MDSLAQAAGRCNREGRLSEPGQVIFFCQTSRSYSARALMVKGLFGDHGRALLSLIVEPGQPVDDHAVRLIHGDGKWTVVARKDS